jgi:hypothetical protein
MGQYVVTIVVAVLLISFVIYQQLRTRPINARQLVVLPVILAILGIVNVNRHPPASVAADTALVASVVIALAFGIARGFTTQVWWSDGVLLRKGTWVTLALWIVGIAFRLAVGVVAQREGVSANVTSGEIPLFLGITLAAQNVLIWLRGQEVPLTRGRTAG